MNGPGDVAALSLDDAALNAQALALDLSAEVLDALSVGQIISATVLPPQAGSDVIEINGRSVPAQLPPNVHPGETLVLEVTGSNGTRIYVRNLGSPPAPKPAAPVAPPREVFVAASVRPSAPETVKATTAPVLLTPRAQVQNAVGRIAQQTVGAVSEMLRAVRAPDIPMTRSAAAIAAQAPQRVPAALRQLEAALPATSADARITTLRTILAFISRMNPQREQTLAAQIEAYVSHAAQGSESKLLDLLTSLARIQSPRSPTAQTALPDSHLRSQALPDDVQRSSQGPIPPDLRAPAHDIAPANAGIAQTVASQARGVERALALDHDLKAIVLSLLRDQPAEATPKLAQALSEALVTVTGAQFNALSSTIETPGVIALTLPVYYREEGKPAFIRISGDAGSRAQRLDAENFHIAFVLDTANLGTVAVELQTTARSVKINVKTDDAGSAPRFSSTLTSLRERLEGLRYRVVSAVASAAARSAPTRSAEEPAAPRAHVDLQA